VQFLHLSIAIHHLSIAIYHLSIAIYYLSIAIYHLSIAIYHSNTVLSISLSLHVSEIYEYITYYSRQVLAFRSCVVKVSILLGRGAASLGDWYPTFADSVLVFKRRKLLQFSILEDETSTLARHVGHQSLCDVVSHLLKSRYNLLRYSFYNFSNIC
jgi:hypothetical protein